MKMIFLILLIWGPFTFAGGGGVETSGGGTGVLVDGRIELLDLVEAGIQSTQIVLKPASTYNVLNRRLEFFDLANEVDILTISSYLDLIWQKDPFLAEGIVRTIRLYQWALVSEPLKLQVPNTVITAPLHQIALRKGASIYIDRDLFGKMDRLQRVALVIHEALSALGNPNLPESRTRQIIGRLFSNSFPLMNRVEFAKLLGEFYISEAAVRMKLAKKFQGFENLRDFIVDFPLLRSTSESQFSSAYQRLGFFPNFEYSLPNATKIVSFQKQGDPSIPCDGSPQSFDVWLDYFVINVLLPLENGVYAPYASWEIQKENLASYKFTGVCSAEMREKFQEGLDDFKTNFFDGLSGPY